MSSMDVSRTALLPGEALDLVLSGISAPETEVVSLKDSLGRYLPHPVCNRVDQPPFDKSGMDGFAYRQVSGAYADPRHKVPGAAPRYRIVATLQAGSSASVGLEPGCCARIMTGARIPSGAVGVQRVEWTTLEGLDTVRFDRQETSTNIIMKGENLLAGAVLLEPRRLEPADIGILASSGYAEVEVARKPVVGILSTGDELVSPGRSLPEGAIFDSNGPQLAAQVESAGAIPRILGIVRDDEASLVPVLKDALAECDVVIVSGGVSMGDFDFVPAAFRTLGVKQAFHGLAMRPGKPTFFGTLGDKAAFGMPGNPVSTFVNFEVLVRPYLALRMGVRHEPRMIRARLASDLVRRGSDRVEFLPARLFTDKGSTSMCVDRLTYHGSSMLSVLAQTDSLLSMDIGQERIPEGEVVDVRLLRP